MLEDDTAFDDATRIPFLYRYISKFRFTVESEFTELVTYQVAEILYSANENVLEEEFDSILLTAPTVMALGDRPKLLIYAFSLVDSADSLPAAMQIAVFVR